MNIQIKDIITLDDNNKYMVVGKISYENKIYYYISDINNNTNIKFCYEDDKYIVELTDKEMITKLLPLFYKNISESLFDE